MNALTSSSRQPLTPSNLAARAFAVGHSLSGQEAAGLTSYLELLLKWNAKMNLVGHNSWELIFDDLVRDSLELLPFLQSLPLPGAPVCWDFGSGAGIPGIPLRLIWGAGDYTMVEIREKRSLFLQNALASLPITNTHIFRGKAEDFIQQSPAVDVVVSRAFMPWLKVLDLVEKFIRPQCFVVFLTLQKEPEYLPKGWALHSSKCYEVPPLPERRKSGRGQRPGGAGANAAEATPRTRYFWAFQKL